MAGRRKAIELAMSEEDLAALRAIARSRTEPAGRVERARMLLAYRDEPLTERIVNLDSLDSEDRRDC